MRLSLLASGVTFPLIDTTWNSAMVTSLHRVRASPRSARPDRLSLRLTRTAAVERGRLGNRPFTGPGEPTGRGEDGRRITDVTTSGQDRN
jgi:hypothetical protein